MNSLLFYQKPVRLNREEHNLLKFQSSNAYGFAESVNSVPLNGIEFFQTSRHLPVLFSCDASGDYFPIALLSLHDKQHFLGNPEGEWGEVYVPAFIRRYPFAMSDDQTVCFDQSAPHFDEAGESLFTEDGEQSDTLNRVIEFLVSFDQAHQQTRAFCEAAKEQNLFKPFNIQVMVKANEPLRLNGLFVINEEVFSGLPKTVVNKWFKSGWVAWVYAHLHSLATLATLAKYQARAESSGDLEKTTEENNVKNRAEDDYLQDENA
jgi:hypothetical protein